MAFSHGNSAILDTVVFLKLFQPVNNSSTIRFLQPSVSQPSVLQPDSRAHGNLEHGFLGAFAEVSRIDALRSEPGGTS
jgi:hypothetical protein